MKVKEVHIGHVIEEACKQSNYTKVEIAKMMGFSKQVLNNRFKNDDWGVKELFTISRILGRDFVAPFTQPKEDESQRTKVILHIEIDKEKSDEVLRYIKDKKLYELLKDSE